MSFYQMPSSPPDSSPNGEGSMARPSTSTNAIAMEHPMSSPTAESQDKNVDQLRAPLLPVHQFIDKIVVKKKGNKEKTTYHYHK